MGEGITYWSHLNTTMPEKVSELISDDIDVFQYKRGRKKEKIFFNDGTYAYTNRKGELKVVPYLGMAFAEACDIALTPFTLRSLILRPIMFVHKKLKSRMYQDVDLQEFEKELDKHGGINLLQVISPPRKNQTDYIKCMDEQRYILDKRRGKVFEFPLCKECHI